MLCSVLEESGLAGRPMELLNPRNLDVYGKVRGPTPLSAMLQEFESRWTTPNGYFGMKLHASQFQQMFGPDGGRGGVAFLGRFSRFILCVRRDKLDQAISHMLAHERDVWQGTDAGQVASIPPRHFAPADVGRIARFIERASAGELFWRQVIAQLDLPAIEVVFEDVISRGQAEFARVFSHLGLTLPETGLPVPATRRLPNEANARLRKGFLQAIGAA
jgi:LPS sulfotransferase NodH